MTPAELAVLRKQMGLKPAADPTAPRVMNESLHQTHLFIWAGNHLVKYPELRWLHSVPNGGLRDKGTAGKMKGEGQKQGVVDVFLDVPRGGYHGLRIELKVPELRDAANQKIQTKGVLSPEQKEWLDHYRTNGYCAKVAYGWIQAKEIIEEYLQ